MPLPGAMMDMLIRDDVIGVRRRLLSRDDVIEDGHRDGLESRDDVIGLRGGLGSRDDEDAMMDM